jgi:hypothetical protein
MKQWILLFGGALLALAAPAASAFDTQTHAYITYQAFINSNLGNGNAITLLQQVGLDRFDPPQPFSPYWLPLSSLEDFYFDNLPSGAAPLQYERPATAYEWTQMQQLAAAGVFGSNSSSIVGATPFQPLPIANWLIRGSIREDDLPANYYDPRDGATPDADPYGDIRRSLRHFYDPIHNMPLTVGAALGQKSTDWALGTVDAFTSLSPDSTRRTHFSWEDARNNYFIALTAERDANSNGVREASEREADSEERMFRWATTFRSMGDVVHLLEDAAQPQHTRNDRHDKSVNPDDQQGFEPFTNARLIGKQAVSGSAPTPGEIYVRGLIGDDAKLFQQFLTPLPDISGYQIPVFTTPLRFFTTRAPGDDDTVLPDNRYGMADYSNRGFFTRGTTPDASTLIPGVYSYQRPDPTLTGFTTQTTNCSFLPKLRSQPVNCTTVYHPVPDPFQPSRSDVTTSEPLLAEGMWYGLGSTNQYTLTPEIYQTTGNLTVPRAIAYSAGLINYFFRGKLTVTKPSAVVIGVLNQGAQHAMNAQGYPCAGAATNDGCPIFGFQTIRVSIQNSTPQITESVTNTVAQQNFAATAAGNVTDSSFHGPYLVAVAKYHRNTCYSPDLSGEPYQIYNPTPPSTGITQPTCAGKTTRTAYQEISVSKSVVTSAGQLNGGAAAFDVQFDFSADPIPVNATDLFIQVIYRGPMGDANGQEPDAIAVGTLDVHEPTFAAFWNNTDYFWNSGWVHNNSTYHNEGIESFNVCAGFPLKLVYQYVGSVAFPAMIDPVVNSNRPGVARVAVLFAPPDFTTQLRTVEGIPEIYAGDVHIPVNQAGTQGQVHQASQENLLASVLSASPAAYCSPTPPSATPYWCWDPIQQRRGQLMGNLQIPLYEAPFGGAINATDVDSVPLPAFAGLIVQSAGTVSFNNTTQQACPGQITAPTSVDYQNYLNYLNLLYEARELGVSGEEIPTLQQEAPPQH